MRTDFHCYQPSNGESINLLENETSWQKPAQGTLNRWLDPSGRYLCIQFQTVNAILDLQERRVAAQYAVTGRGCLIGDEYWVCIDKKIIRKPFPVFVEAPPIKPVYGRGIDYSKHPELW